MCVQDTHPEQGDGMKLLVLLWRRSKFKCSVWSGGAVPGPGERHVETSGVIKETNALVLIGSHTGENDEIFLSALESIHTGDFHFLLWNSSLPTQLTEWHFCWLREQTGNSNLVVYVGAYGRMKDLQMLVQMLIFNTSFYCAHAYPVLKNDKSSFQNSEVKTQLNWPGRAWYEGSHWTACTGPGRTAVLHREWWCRSGRV